MTDENTGGIHMNPVKDFEKRFGTEVSDLLVLMKADVGAAAVVGDMLRPAVDFIASVNTQTGELSEEKGRLEWMVPNPPGRTGWGYDFRQYQIYHIRARKNIPITLTPDMLSTMNNCYMVVEVLEENIQETRLDAIREHLMKPVTIKDAVFGTFVLDRQFSDFEGTVDWLGTECSVSLETDEQDGDTAGKAYAHLQELYKNRAEWDDKLRQFAAEELLELANEWFDDEDDDDDDFEDEDGEDEIHITHITKKEFLRRISANGIVVTPSGDLTFYYDADDMFTDHAIIIDADMDGNMSGANIG